MQINTRLVRAYFACWWYCFNHFARMGVIKQGRITFLVYAIDVHERATIFYEIDGLHSRDSSTTNSSTTNSSTTNSSTTNSSTTNSSTTNSSTTNSSTTNTEQ